MKTKEKDEKIKEIKSILDRRFDCECEDEKDWMSQYETCLSSIERLINEILGVKE